MSFKNTCRRKEWEKIFHANGNQKKVGITILKSHKMDIKAKIVIRNEKRSFIVEKLQFFLKSFSGKKEEKNFQEKFIFTEIYF